MELLPSKRLSHYFVASFGFITLLLVAHWITVLYVEPGSARANTALGSLFDLDREYNFPTLVNSLLLFTSSILSLCLALKAKNSVQRFGWCLFAMFFAYLSFDELLILHEQLAEPLRKLLNITGSNPLYHAWVIPAIFAISLLLGAVFVLKKYYRDLKVFSDILVLVIILAIGVVACEIVGTFVYKDIDLYRWFMVPVEEIFELSMATLILFNLLSLQSKDKRRVNTKKTAR